MADDERGADEDAIRELIDRQVRGWTRSSTPASLLPTPTTSRFWAAMYRCSRSASRDRGWTSRSPN